MNQVNYKVKFRAVIILGLLILGLSLLGMRLGWIQLFKNEVYQKLALQQRLRNVKVEPKRGVIYDRTGVELAVSASAETVVAAPQDIENPRQTANKLAKILDKSADKIYQRLIKKLAAVYIERKIEESQAKKIRKLDLEGIYFTEESKRYYPRETLAAHLLGFVGVDSQGLQGVELAYDDTLMGTPGRIAIESDALGREIPEGIDKYIAPEDGNNLYLTIDHVLQYIAARELEEAMQQYNARGGTIIMMDPQSGKLLALANRPTYNPNQFADYAPKLWRNKAISDTYEPGSTFKIVTAAAGLEEGVVHPNDKFYDPGYIKVSGQKLHCWKSGGHGKQTFAEVVQNSCNPGFVQVAHRVGKKDFYEYVKAFGFGQSTGIKLPGEAEGLIYDVNRVGPVELATMAFGHGISVTPMQLITAVSAVANNGKLLQPQIVKQVTGPSGKLITKKKPEPVRQIISQATAETLRGLLTGVVEEGSGKNAAIKGYNIAGKTGTSKHYGAQIYDSSFIGFLPADNPQLVTLVVLFGLKGHPYYGSQVAAPIFHDVVKDAVRYLEIPPQKEKVEEKEDEKVEVKQVKVPNVKNLSLAEAENKLVDQGLNVAIEGRGDTVVDQIPQPGVVVEQKSTVILFFPGAKKQQSNYQVTVPNLQGKTRQKAAQLLGELGLRLKWSGSGVVIDQEPIPGVTINYGRYVEVELKPEKQS